MSSDSPSRGAAPAPEEILWRLAVETSTVEARLRMDGDLPVVRVYMNGALLWSELLPDVDEAKRWADDRREAFRAQGWR